MLRLSRIAVCCLLATLATGVFAAPTNTAYVPNGSTRPAPAAGGSPTNVKASSSRALPARVLHPVWHCAPASAVVKLPKNKGFMIQQDMDGLKLGKPAFLLLGLDYSEIEAVAAFDRGVRHLNRDDAIIRQRESDQAEVLKATVLRDYLPEDVQEAGKLPGMPVLAVHIHSFQTLQVFLDDPRVRSVNSNMPMCPA